MASVFAMGGSPGGVRVNTAGGNAPAQPGTAIGEEARVPYTTEYLFYRAR